MNTYIPTYIHTYISKSENEAKSEPIPGKQMCSAFSPLETPVSVDLGLVVCQATAGFWWVQEKLLIGMLSRLLYKCESDVLASVPHLWAKLEISLFF